MPCGDCERLIERTIKQWSYLSVPEYFMKNFNDDSSANLARFGRDKRTRMTAERVERRPRLQRDADDSAAPHPRASFNPNFTEDNRIAGRQQDFHTEGDRKPFAHKPYGERRTYGDKPGADRRSYGEHRASADRPYGERSYGDKPYGDRKPYGGKSNGSERRPYGDKFHGDHKLYSKPYNRNFGAADPEVDYNRAESTDFEPRPRRTYGSRLAPQKPYGRKPYGPRDEQSAEERPRKSGSKFGPKRAPRRDDRPKEYPKYDPNKQTGAMRLNRYIAQSGICSRREADDFISAGLVSVNGVVVTELGSKVMPGDEVKFNDSRVEGEKKVYLVLNKPKGYVTSLEDPHADKTVMELVKGACTERIYPVGRLDKNSVGLLIFTNDGDLTRQLTHPSYRKKKIYQVTIDKPLTRADMEALAEGITLEDGEIHADEVAYVKEDKKEIGVEIHSGRNRIVRRMFEALGYSVQKLDRVYYAGLTKKNLKRGDWRFLTRDEVNRLKSGQYE